MIIIDYSNPKQDFEFKLSSKTKISIIVPCYNAPEDQIRRALLSVQRQTFKDYEVIVVDDGSQEEYSKILQTLCENAENTTLIRMENRGVSAARNTGISVAQGEYIAFLDADDFLAEDFMERAWNVAEKTHADYIIGGVTTTENPADFHFPDHSKVPLYERYGQKTIVSLLPSFISVRHLRKFTGGYLSRGPVARLIRSDHAKEIPFNEKLRIGEDLVWNLQLLLRCESVCIVPESWYIYWENPASATHRYDPDLVGACEEHLEQLSQLLDLTDETLYTAYTEHIYELLRVTWFNYLSTERKRDPSSFRQSVHYLYKNSPWQEFGSLRFLRSAEKKKKCISLLYKMHLLFEMMALKEDFSRR